MRGLTAQATIQHGEQMNQYFSVAEAGACLKRSWRGVPPGSGVGVAERAEVG
jgi:hypothetical protein